MDLLTFLAFFASALLGGILDLSGRIVALPPNLPTGIFVSTAVSLVAVYLFIPVLLWAAAQKAKLEEEKENPNIPPPSLLSALETPLAVPVIILLGILALRFFVPVPWMMQPAARYLSQAGLGFFYTATHWVFFSCVERRRQPSLYFSSFLTGAVFTELLLLLFNSVQLKSQDVTAKLITSFGYSIVVILMLALFITLVWALLLMWRKPGFQGWMGEPEEALIAGQSLSMKRLLLLMVVFYILNTLVSGAYIIYAPTMTLKDNFLLITLFACVALPLFGRILSSGLTRGVRWTVAFSAVVLAMTPAFSAFTPDPAVYRPLHAAAGVAHWVFFLGMTVVLAQTVSGKWRMYALLLPHAFRIIAILLQPLLQRTLFPNHELTLVVALVAAVGFYLLASGLRAPVDVVEAEPVEEEPLEEIVSDAAVEPEPEPESEPEPEPDKPQDELARMIDERVLELAADHNFSQRETEIAILLAHGQGGPEIADQLELSLNTVNTYIRRIMQKCGGIRRKEFVGLAFKKD